MDPGKPLQALCSMLRDRPRTTIDLAPGDHSLSAVYTGDSAHLGLSGLSHSGPCSRRLHPDFSVSVAPATLSLEAGTVGIGDRFPSRPSTRASLTAPMFVTISCSGLPDQSACTFTPENIEIPVGATAAINSSMVIATQATSLATAEPIVTRRAARCPGSAAARCASFSVESPLAHVAVAS